MNLTIKELPTICLNMIVKNESKIILDTLENLCSYMRFHYWVICDTGSTDDTKEKIIEFFERKGIAGELIEHKWQDFAHNRTLALNAAYNKTDYLFLFDADDRISGDFKLPTNLSKDKYLYKFGTSNFSYNRPNLLSNRKKWKFIGVLHEFISNIDHINGEELINGDYHIEIGVHGARASNPNKYLDDALLLEKAFETEPDNHLKSRYAFYCAQSYKDCEKLEKSIEWYSKVLELDNWSQEKYYSCLQLGNLYFRLNDEKNAIKLLSKASEYDCERIDCITVLMAHYYNNENHLLVNALYNKYKNYNLYNYDNKLFLNTEAWVDFEYYNSISAYYVHDFIGGYNSCKKLLEYEKKIEITNSNIKFYFNMLKL
jgi:hypothetical protein